jgi:hypothetical protein
MDGATAGGGVALGRAPRYLLHDRDSIYDRSFRQRVRGMAIQEGAAVLRKLNPTSSQRTGAIAGATFSAVQTPSAFDQAKQGAVDGK